MSPSPLETEVLLHWGAVLAYAAATVAFAWGACFSKDAAFRPAVRLAWAGLAIHAAALAVRWLASGHGPYMARYEVLSSNVWLSVFLFLLLCRRTPGLLPVGTVILPLCFLMMTAALFLEPAVHSLPPSLRSFWLVIHVLFAKIGAGSMTIALGTAALFLAKDRGTPSWLARFPPPERLDELGARLVGFGFVSWTVMIAAGAVWANESWGRYWGWDPIETWSLVTWLLFGAYLHGRRFFRLRGRAAAGLIVLCYAVSMGTLFAVPVASKLHLEYFR